jgi:hypothetical protein
MSHSNVVPSSVEGFGPVAEIQPGLPSLADAQRALQAQVDASKSFIRRTQGRPPSASSYRKSDLSVTSYMANAMDSQDDFMD